MQSIDRNIKTRKEVELVAQVELAFVTFKSRKLDFAFLMLQNCMDNILAIHGDNNYLIQNDGKERMLAHGTLPAV